MSNQTISILISSLTFALTGCLDLSKASVSGATSATSTNASSNVAVTRPVYCQNPPYNYDSPLPACQTTQSCIHAQVPDGAGHCVDYTCDQMIELAMPAAGATLQVPTRSNATHGTCYSLHLISPLDFGPSNLTVGRDPEVISRNHDPDGNDASRAANPYLMGRAQINLAMNDVRMVALSGAADVQTPILVDNFVLVGLYPLGTTSPVSPDFYAAFGTSDSTTTLAGNNSILVDNVSIPVTAFATGGTASLSAVNVSSDVVPNFPYTLDIRAEDCGGSRQLSDIYMVFR